MPKLREILLQVNERHARDLRLRTQVRCAQLLADAHPNVAHPNNIEAHPNVTHIEVHPNVAQGQLRVQVRVSIEEHPNVTQGPLRLPRRENIDAHQTSKDWTTCINVTCFLLLLFLANCLILQYISIRKT